MIQNLLDDFVASGREIGIQVAATVDGRLELDAVAGLADTATGRKVAEDTVFPSFSVGKGIAAIVVAALVDRGVLDYAAPVTKYWPEFGAHGKDAITLGQVLTHEAGLADLPPAMTVEQFVDTRAIAAWLADQRPAWEPGTATGYHGWTYGFLIAEIIRRATGREIDDILREITAPLGIPDELFFAVPDRIDPATLYDGNWSAILQRLPEAFQRCAPAPVAPTADLANRPEVRRVAVPAAATVSARAAALLYAAVSSGDLISPETFRAATTLRTADTDRVLGAPIPKAYGFFLGGPHSSWGTRPTVFGHTGSGGSIAFADPERRLTVAVTHNRLIAGPEETLGAIVSTVRAQLGLSD